MSSVRALCDEFWSWRMSEYPELGTAVGHHDNDHRWDDMSQETVGKRKVRLVGSATTRSLGGLSRHSHYSTGIASEFKQYCDE